jgi:hypothetical protein
MLQENTMSVLSVMAWFIIGIVYIIGACFDIDDLPFYAPARWAMVVATFVFVGFIIGLLLYPIYYFLFNFL